MLSKKQPYNISPSLDFKVAWKYEVNTKYVYTSDNSSCVPNDQNIINLIKLKPIDTNSRIKTNHG